MRISNVISIMTLCLLILSGVVNSAPCRTAEAAVKGAEDGFKLDKDAAYEVARKERSSSNILGRCVGSITAIFTTPQFPSLAAIFKRIQEQICRMVSQKVDDAVGAVNGQIDGILSGVNKRINDAARNATKGTPLEGEIPSAGVSGPRVNRSTGNSASEFWRNIYK
ncbi:hypothetical protein KCM76_22140 [Zooshikella marina]|uniref:hypothetical protein n=1 Tax=Zooshikella ganghwensis TaxID=202772 RepID=UPI001BB0589B|nr:hypothetical protein [Zooshikella ganghwensis]MBU2708709.1 hypothetical protein [Zooshikella ganghwensis]